MINIPLFAGLYASLVLVVNFFHHQHYHVLRESWVIQGIPLLRCFESGGCGNAGETHGLLEQCPTAEAIDVQLPKGFSHMQGSKWTKITSQKLNNIIQHQNNLLIYSTHLKPRTKLKKLLHFNIPIDDIPWQLPSCCCSSLSSLRCLANSLGTCVVEMHL